MNGSRLPLRVVKVGGSLLDWPDLPSALDRWLAGQPAAIHILLGGGGPFADAIRRADSVFDLGEEASHWLCIECLGVSTSLLAAIVPRARRVSTLADLQSGILTSQLGLIVFDPREFLKRHEPHLPGTRLPQAWQATSDSIAARLAETLAADELVLLKSADQPAGGHAALAAAGYVDAHFPVAARPLPQVRFVNLSAA
jgi:5-(aminomethyl)-3-furanmethanol phosphate kinase